MTKTLNSLDKLSLHYNLILLAWYKERTYVHFMDISYDNSKTVQCYKNFVEHPDDRTAIRNFVKSYGQQLMGPAKKLHDRLKHHKSAGAYNKIYISTDNRIEIKRGEQDNSALILKVRINRSFRKFFYSICTSGEVLLNRDWVNDFDSVVKIRVIEISKHDYDF